MMNIAILVCAAMVHLQSSQTALESQAIKHRLEQDKADTGRWSETGKPAGKTDTNTHMHTLSIFWHAHATTHAFVQECETTCTSVHPNIHSNI